MTLILVVIIGVATLTLLDISKTLANIHLELHELRTGHRFRDPNGTHYGDSHQEEK